MNNLSKKQKKKNRHKKSLAISKATMDVIMDEASNQKQEKPLSKGWNKVTITNAAKFEKDVVLSSLARNCTESFNPVCFTKNGGNYTFYVESHLAASSLKLLDKKISLTHNFLMKIKVAPSPPPKHELNEEVREKIKMVMSSRYNITEKSLNMKNFHNDVQLCSVAYVPLARSNVMNNVIRVIGENVPNIEAIDFSENKLPSLDYFSLLEENAPNLKLLNLSNNRLNDIKQLEKLRDLNLKVLHLKNNPLENKFPDRTELIANIRRTLPKLEILDDEELPKHIQFEDEVNSSKLLPLREKLMSVDENAKEIILTFLKHYYSLYDQDNRGPLIEAYHSMAMFSMSAAYPPNTTSHGVHKLTLYQADARNLNMIVKPSKRLSFLKMGNENVVKFLNDLPKTCHDLNSFTLDVPFVSDKLATMTVTGVFQERALKPPPLRQFHRTFIIVPQGSGFVIVNDSLFITNAIGPQVKAAFQNESSIMSKLSPEEKQRLVNILCQKTNLRLDWAQKALEESNWSLDEASIRFLNAQKEGKIPQEAYAFTPSC